MLDSFDRILWLDLWRAPPPDAVEELRLELRLYGPALVLAFGAQPQNALLNRLLGAGGLRAVQDGHLQEALDWTESLALDCTIPIASHEPEAAAAEDILNRRGYRQIGFLARFLHDTGPPRLSAPPRFEVVDRDEFDEGFSTFPEEGFGLDLIAGCFFGGLPGRESWRCYVAIDEEEGPVASASMLLHFQFAQLAFAATTEPARGKGAHLAMLRRRILDAHAAGCRTVFAETEEPLDLSDAPSPGARNLVRAGFTQTSVRRIWRPPEARGEEGEEDDL
jgi:hypothetical protein